MIAIALLASGCKGGAPVGGEGGQRVGVSNSRSKTIDQCLSGDRPDMAVSLWLQDKSAHGMDGLPPEVANAVMADGLLMEVNSGGFEGFFDWRFDSAAKTVGAIDAMGLPDVSRSLKAAMQLMCPGPWPATKEGYETAKAAFDGDDKRSAEMNKLDQRVIGESLKIEKATHDYIRKHIVGQQYS